MYGNQFKMSSVFWKIVEDEVKKNTEPLLPQPSKVMAGVGRKDENTERILGKEKQY